MLNEDVGLSYFQKYTKISKRTFAKLFVNILIKQIATPSTKMDELIIWINYIKNIL